MAILDEGTVETLRERFEGLIDPVLLRLYRTAGSARLILPGGTGCKTCDEAEALLRELATIVPKKLMLEVIDVEHVDSAIADVPSVTIGRIDEEHRIRFQGVPEGYEFATLLDAVERVSGANAGLPPLGDQIGDADRVEIMVFVTPTCPYCPGAASMANRMALADPRITSVVVEANEFPDLSDEFGVRGVPQTVVNRKGSFVGAMPPLGFVAEVVNLASASS